MFNGQTKQVSLAFMFIEDVIDEVKFLMLSAAPDAIPNYKQEKSALTLLVVRSI